MRICTASRHGTASAAHNAGCTCPSAVLAETRRRKHAAVYGSPHAYVDSVGTIRRIRALQALGWPLDTLAVRLGLSERRVWGITTQDRVRRHTRDLVAALYEQLSGTPGPSTRARDRARREGWAPPLAWSDVSIDDPAAEPDIGANPRSRGGQLLVDLDEVDHLLWCGESLEEIAARLGVQVASIHRARLRTGGVGAQRQGEGERRSGPRTTADTQEAS